MINNFISGIIDSSSMVVNSIGNATDKIVSISNPLVKRENESSEDYQLRLEYLERKKEKGLQFKLEKHEAKKQARIKKQQKKEARQVQK